MPQPYKKIKHPERQRLIAIITVAIVVFSAWLILSPHGAVRYYRLSHALQTMANENQQLANENKELTKEIYRLRNDRAHQEMVARQQFGMLKKNEMVFDFSNEKKKDKEEE